MPIGPTPPTINAIIAKIREITENIRLLFELELVPPPVCMASWVFTAYLSYIDGDSRVACGVFC